MAPTNASAATETMGGKEKPSSNLDMEGQRVRTTKPPRNTRTTAELAQRIAEELRRPKPKEVAHHCRRLDPQEAQQKGAVARRIGYCDQHPAPPPQE